MKKNFLLMIGLGLFFCGCHTIRPLATPVSTYISQVPKINATADLIIDEKYAAYVSKDRGNALADPQKYYVGEALAPLTKQYFEKTFKTVSVLSSKPETTSKDYVIYPQVKNFENSLSLGEQSITLSLQADLYDRHMNLLKTVSVQGASKGDLGMFSDEDDAGMTVTHAIQKTLVTLLKTIQTETQPSQPIS